MVGGATAMTLVGIDIVGDSIPCTLGCTLPVNLGVEQTGVTVEAGLGNVGRANNNTLVWNLQDV